MRAETWLYDLVGDAWTRVEEATLPFGVGMNYNLEFDPGHRLLLLVAVPSDEPLAAVWALRLGDEARRSPRAEMRAAPVALEDGQSKKPRAKQPTLPPAPGAVGRIKRDEHGNIVPVNPLLPATNPQYEGKYAPPLTPRSSPTPFPAQTNGIEVGSLEIDPPTLRSLGFSLPIASGDENYNAVAEVEYRKQSTSGWRTGLPLLCIRPEMADFPRGESFAGSIFGLDEDATYEVRITISDPDGGNATRMATVRTRSIPTANPANPYLVNVSNSAELSAALSNAVPGHVITLAPGT